MLILGLILVASVVAAIVYRPAPSKGQKALKTPAQRGAVTRATPKASAKARARAHAAYVAAANRWHRGYAQQNYNVFWKPVRGRLCAASAPYGCWHIQVITRAGCPTHAAVVANEYDGKTIVGSLIANNPVGIPAKTPAVFELDSDRPKAPRAGDVKIECR
jgi:hypothetical protein